MDLRDLACGLVEPRVRTALGVVFALAVSWQLLFGGSHIAVWYTIYGSWAAAVLLLFLLSHAGERQREDEPESAEAGETSDV